MQQYSVIRPTIAKLELVWNAHVQLTSMGGWCTCGGDVGFIIGHTLLNFSMHDEGIAKRACTYMYTYSNSWSMCNGMELNGNVGYMIYVVPANTPHMHMASVTHCMLTVLNCQLPTSSSWTWVCIPILSMSHALNQFSHYGSYVLSSIYPQTAMAEILKTKQSVNASTVYEWPKKG